MMISTTDREQLTLALNRHEAHRLPRAALAVEARSPWRSSSARGVSHATMVPPCKKPTRSASLREVLAFVATGMANRDIAKRLFVSVGAIKTHVHRILAKLDVGNRTEAVHRARQLGLLSGSS